MMNGLLTYAVGSAAVLAVLWGGFRLLLRSQKLFRVNRALLNTILYFSLCAPLLLSRLSIPVSERAPEVVGVMTLAGVTVSSDGSRPAAMAENSSTPAWLPEVLTAVYAAGAVATMLTHVLIPAAAAAVLLLRGRRFRALSGGHVVTVVSVPARRGRRVEPMSWLGVIFLPAEEDYDNDSYVIRHELAHIRMMHSPILLNASLMLCLQWFNPAAWLLLRDLRQNCEFEADDAVLASGADRKEYQLSLVGQAAKGMAVSLANPFRNSNLYRRIAMIHKAVPERKVYARLLYVVPVLMAAAVIFAEPLVPAAAMPAETGAGNMTGSSAYVPDPVPVPYTLVEQPPVFMGGDDDDFAAWVFSAIQYPAEAVASDAAARVTVQFKIRKTGEVSDIRTLRVEVKGTVVEDFDYNIFSEAVVDVVGRSPGWTPGYQHGKPVDVVYNFPVDFRLKNE